MQFLRPSIERSKPEWSNDEKRSFINFYNANPSLWNHRLKDYHDRARRQVLLQQLREQLAGKYTEKEIVTTWNNIKTYFDREPMREEASKSSGTGTSEVKKCESVHFSQYTFVFSQHMHRYSWLARDVTVFSIFGYPPCWGSTAGKIYMCLLCNICHLCVLYDEFFGK